MIPDSYWLQTSQEHDDEIGCAAPGCLNMADRELGAGLCRHHIVVSISDHGVVSHPV